MSMKGETLSINITGDGKRLAAELGRSEKSIKAFSGKVGGMLSGVRKGFNGAVGKMAANPLALIGGAAGVMMAARNLVDYQDSLSSLGITAGLSAEQMMSLGDRINKLSYTTGQSREQLAAALKSMSSDVDTEFATAAIESVGKAATAMSIDIGDAASAFVAFRRDMGATTEEAEKMFNSMVAMDSNFDLKRLASSAQTLGLTKDNFADYNAFIQTIKPNFGGAEGAAKAVDNIAMALQTDKRFQRDLGPEIINTDGTIKDFRKLIEKMASMSAKQRKTRFGNYGKAFLPFDDANGFKVFDDYINKGKEANFVADAFSRKQKEGKFQMNMLSAAAKDFAGMALTPVLADLTAQMGALTSDPAALQSFQAGIQGIAGAFGALGKVVGVVGKALGAWGDMWEWLGDKYGKMVAGPDPMRKNHNPSGRSNVASGRRAPPTLQTATSQAGASTPAGSHRSNRTRLQYASRTAPTVNVAPPDVKNAINLNIQVTEGGRVISQSDDKNTTLNANVNRGKF